MAALCSARHQSAAAGSVAVLGLQVELELTVKELPLGRGAPQYCTGVHEEGCVAAGSLRAASSLRRVAFPPGRLPASVFRLPPFPRNLNPARLDPGSPLGGEAPALFRLYSFLSGWPSSLLSPFPAVGLTLFDPL